MSEKRQGVKASGASQKKPVSSRQNGEDVLAASSTGLIAFKKRVLERGAELYRDLPWRNTRDPYAVLVSEVMLQQTQVSRVDGRWQRWLEKFPTLQALASAPLGPVLEEWQGMGYNRRALNLKRAAEVIVSEFGGLVPQDHDELVSLPGVGPATAAGVRAFAFDEPDIYLETNVRAVFLHELFPDAQQVPDKLLRQLVGETCPEAGEVRTWYYALLDYGAYLKRTVPNPSRRAKAHTVQSAFEGSHRQKRAYLLRRVLEAPSTTEELAEDLSGAEEKAGRQALSAGDVEALLVELETEGFIVRDADFWRCAE